jgi:aspartate/methionine/tyrosine aminotransferase
MAMLPVYKLADYQAFAAPLSRFPMGASMPAPMTLDKLLSRATQQQRDDWQNLGLAYVDSHGGIALRESIAGLYPGLDASHIQVFSGAQEAIFALYHALLAKGDSMQTITPLYEPLQTVAEYFGAEIKSVPMRAIDGHWQLDLDEWLASLMPDTRMAAINFPHNPTGSMISKLQLQMMVDQCREIGCWLFSDEVFRGLEHNSQQLPPVASVYEKGISLGVVSKAYGLGGIRVGWIACQDQQLIQKLHRCRQFLSICSGSADELLATIAVQQHELIIKDNLDVIKHNLAWFEARLPAVSEKLEWIAPQAGCVAYPKLLAHASSRQILEALLREKGVMAVPGDCFRQGDAHFRVGFGRTDFKQAWEIFEAFLQISQ